MSGAQGSSIVRSFAALASGDAVGRVVAFLAGVWVARELGASMFGVMAFGQAVVLYFTHLAACGLELTGTRDVAADPTRANTHAPSILTARTLVSAGLALALALGALVLLPPLDAAVVALYAATLFGHGPNPRFVLLGLGRPTPVALARTAGEVVYALLVVLLVRWKYELIYVPWAQAIGDVLAVLLLLLALRRMGYRMPLELDWPRVKPLFAASFPLVLNILLGLLIFNSDLLVLRAFRDSATVGWYSASYQLISFLINMSGVYALSLMPVLAKARPQPDEHRAVYLNSLAQALCIGLPIAVGGGLLAPGLITLVFGPDYGPSALPLSILIASIPFLLAKDIAMVAMVAGGHEKAVLRFTALAVVVNLVSNLLVIPRFGMVGAASTTLATEILRAILGALYVRREQLPLLPFARIWRALLASAAMALFLVLVPAPHVLIAVALGAGVFGVVLLACGGVVRGESGGLRLRV